MSDLRQELEALVEDADEAMRVRDRLLAARLIAHDQVTGAGEELVLAVFRELCQLRATMDDGYEGDDMATLH